MPYAPAATTASSDETTDTTAVAPTEMTKEMIEAAQKAWGDGIVKIAAAHTSGGDYVQTATDHINTLYAYGKAPVLFKPTLAADEQFRPTFDEALSYFVANNDACPEDKGFAIKGWTAVRFENVDIITEGSVGMAMGNYFFTTPEGDEAKVEYSFGYMLDADDNVRIILHHSSMPYAPSSGRLLRGLRGLLSDSKSRSLTSSAEMTKELIEAAQKAWGDGIVHIAKTHTDGDDYVQAATDHINNLYAYGLSTVLFKPTLAAEEQFRPTFDKALSYFVASNNACPEDKGFAIKGWTAVRFENEDIITEGNVGMAMGNYFFTLPDGSEVKVEYSFGYMLDDDNNVRIILHHSTKPYERSARKQLRALSSLASSNSRRAAATAEMTLEAIFAAQKAWGDGIVKIAATHTANGDFVQAA